MNRTDFLKKLGLGSIALAVGNKIDINNIPEDEFYDNVINNIQYITYDPSKLETIDHMFKTPSGYTITAKQILDNTIMILNQDLEIAEKENIYSFRLFKQLEEEFLWLSKNWSWDDYSKSKIDQSLLKIKDIEKRLS